ncbi:hypothetical protein D3C80_1956890 [compost metagenome]
MGTTSLKTLRPCWTNILSVRPSDETGSWASVGRAARFRKPKLLRMLLEKLVFSFVPTMFQPPGPA